MISYSDWCIINKVNKGKDVIFSDYKIFLATYRGISWSSRYQDFAEYVRESLEKAKIKSIQEG